MVIFCGDIEEFFKFFEVKDKNGKKNSGDEKVESIEKLLKDVKFNMGEEKIVMVDVSFMFESFMKFSFECVEVEYFEFLKFKKFKERMLR